MKEMKKVMQSIFIQAAKQPMVKYFQIESRWLNISRLGIDDDIYIIRV